MNNKPDEFYIERTLNGDVNAFSRLVERYQHMIYTLTFRIVKTKEEAEEVAQDVFVKAFRNLPNFKGDSKFSTWLYKIAYYASLDVVKKNKRKASTSTIDEVKELELGGVQDALETLHSKERKAVLQNALMKLKEEDRIILTLFYFEELSIKEITKVVNLTEDNIKIKLYRSRKKLFSILKNVIEPRTIDLI